MKLLLTPRAFRPTPFALRLRNASPRRPFSAKPPPHPASETAHKQSRLDRVVSRLPTRLRIYLLPLRHAPLTHITAFLLLHELTAIVPLVGLAATFHYADWLPPYISEGAWVKEGVEKFGQYFRRKGWISDTDETEAEAEGDAQQGRGRTTKAWVWGEGGVRVLVEVGTAWAITKALLPMRLLLSVWATPWFARVCLLPITNGFRRTFGRGGAKVASSSSSSAIAGTGAVGAGALPKKGGLPPGKR